MNQANDHSHIPDWGVDLDPARRPAVPMEHTPPRLEGLHWDRPAQQPRTVEVLHSIERPGIPPVFGTSVPPSGVSGWIRRRAFRRSESDLRHWMLLLLADRVNVAEGLVDDVRRSPRARAAAFGVAGAALAVWMLRRRRQA
ncbi:MAG TPA: hypothetical protein VFH59_16490 [Frateuria sp.]|uniref:hypothetical protein n=1 Tax=Frateuria sp. TaxID=2211372 RepID=UPI002D801648|nr:hypothetical protein [Frateuria sp.]HET6807035.1 hypothetical protein [Frateuria sp.]